MYLREFREFMCNMYWCPCFLIEQNMLVQGPRYLIFDPKSLNLGGPFSREAPTDIVVSDAYNLIKTSQSAIFKFPFLVSSIQPSAFKM